MTLSPAARRIAAAALLAAATLVALGATQMLARLRALPLASGPYYAAFLVALLLAFVAGVVAARAPHPDPLPGGERERLACGPMLSAAAGLAAVLFLFQTWRLDQLASPPRSIFLWWLAGIAATLVAFPGIRRNRKVKRPLLPAALLGLALVAAGAVRMTNLGHSPAVYGGDEANQAMDGRSFLEGRWRESPFAAGWYHTMRPGMLLAGAGAMSASDPVAGARLPYAVVGTLSVAASAAAAWLIAGPWGGAAAAALLAFAPHHVHFSRLSSVMILDALFAPLCLFLLLTLWRSASPRVAALAGVAAGLALYGYAGGRAITLVFLVMAPVAALKSPARRKARFLLLVPLLLGFLAAAGPNIQFAIQRFRVWNGRFKQVSVVSREWWETAVRHWGSAEEAVKTQLASGTVGLLSAEDLTSWFGGYPIIGPSLLVALGFAGLGFLFGRRRLFPATLLLLLAGANVAGVVLTSGAPTPQRASSLVPMLAILGGAAVAGFVALLPESAAGVRWRAIAGTVFVATYLAATAGRRPSSPESSPHYAGAHTAFAQVVSELLRAPAWRSRPAYVYGLPYLSTDLPTFHYVLGDRRPKDVDPASVDPRSLPPGLHFFGPEFERLGRRAETESCRRGFPLPHPVDPLRNVGYAVGVPAVRPGQGS